MGVLSLGREDPLEEGMAIHSSILAGEIPQTEEPGGLQSVGSKRVRHNCSDLAHTQAGSSLLPAGFSQVAAIGGYSPAVVLRLLAAVASLVGEQGL